MWRHIVERVTPTFRTITTQQICNFCTYKKGTHRTTHTKSKRVHGSKLQLGFQHTIPRSTPNAVRHSTLRPLWCAATHIDSTKLKAYTQNAPFFPSLRTRKPSCGVLAYADFLTAKGAFLRGHDKMDTCAKVSWSVVEQQSQRISGEKILFHVKAELDKKCYRNPLTLSTRKVDQKRHEVRIQNSVQVRH